MTQTFRNLLRIFLVLAAASPVLRAQTLRQEADRAGLLVGAAAAPFLLSQGDYARTLASQFNMVEAENSMKWRATEPERGKFDFSRGDELVAFAEAHHMAVRGHNLLWYIYNPAWLERGHFTPGELREIMRDHIMRVAGHYAGKVFAWDVVNEAFDGHGRVRSSIWYDEPGIGLAGKGTAYIAQAFRWAHEADPKALLFYNDYADEGINAKSDAIYAMVKDFKARGVPIDGVGFQSHLRLGAKGLSSFGKNLARFAALGVQIHITELDCGIPIGPDGKPLHSADLKKQAKIYRRVAEACSKQPACTALQTWGVADKYSWIPHHTHGKRGAALMFDRDYQPKPAFEAVMDIFSRAANDSKIVDERRKLERRQGN
jgi:endo-1,4-beta-xylanase